MSSATTYLAATAIILSISCAGPRPRAEPEHNAPTASVATAVAAIQLMEERMEHCQEIPRPGFAQGLRELLEPGTLEQVEATTACLTPIAEAAAECFATCPDPDVARACVSTARTETGRCLAATAARVEPD
jgi:hypothetical protein